MSQAAAQSESAGLRTAMLAATIVSGLLLMLAIWPLSMSPMIFDSGESTETWSMFLAIWAMPVVLLASLVTGWIGFAHNAYGMVVIGLSMAALPILAVIGVLVMSGF